MNSKPDINLSNKKKDEKEIDLKLLFKSIRREKNFLFLIVLFSSVTTAIYSLVAKPVWIGGFNIVIKDKNISSKSNSQTEIQKFIGSKKFDESETQKLILKSPSVLLPVFEFRKNYYADKKNENITFKSWLKDELFIDYEEGSTVLNVTYKNEDKDLILDVLNLISSKYKNYSKKEQIKNLTKTRDYLEAQKTLMEEKSKISQKKYNKFTIENGLGNIDGFVGLGEYNNVLSNNNSIENILNKRSLGNLITFNKATINNSDARQRYKTLFSKLEVYEAQYVDLSSKLKPNSNILTALKTKIDNLKLALKRPNEILIEYKKLSNDARRDSRLLADIEYNLEIVKLDQIRTPDAWELISIPTIDKNRIYPIRTWIVINGIILSTIFGCIFILLKEKLSGIIYDIDKIEIDSNCLILNTLIKENQELSLQLFDKIISDFKDQEIGLIFLNDYKDNSLLNEICKNKMLKKVSFKDKKSISQLKKIMIIIEKGKVTYNDIYLLNKYITIHQEKIIGWLYVDSQI